MAATTTPAWFNADYYLHSKLAQLQDTFQVQNTINGPIPWVNVQQVQQAIQSAGLTVYQHFTLFSLLEGTSPDSLFDSKQYLEAKAVQMNLGESQWSYVGTLLSNAGYTSAYQHYADWGWKEGVNPSNGFNSDGYIAEMAVAKSMTVAAVTQALIAANLNPLSHYYQYGIGEGLVPVPVLPIDQVEAIDYVVTAAPVAINEGAAVEFTLSTHFVEPGTHVQYTLVGTGNAAGQSYAGEFVVGRDGMAKAVVSVPSNQIFGDTGSLNLTLNNGFDDVTVTVTDVTANPITPIDAQFDKATLAYTDALTTATIANNIADANIQSSQTLILTGTSLENAREAVQDANVAIAAATDEYEAAVEALNQAQIAFDLATQAVSVASSNVVADTEAGVAAKLVASQDAATAQINLLNAQGAVSSAAADLAAAKLLDSGAKLNLDAVSASLAAAAAVDSSLASALAAHGYVDAYGEDALGLANQIENELADSSWTIDEGRQAVYDAVQLKAYVAAIKDGTVTEVIQAQNALDAATAELAAAGKAGNAQYLTDAQNDVAAATDALEDAEVHTAEAEALASLADSAYNQAQLRLAETKSEQHYENGTFTLTTGLDRVVGLQDQVNTFVANESGYQSSLNSGDIIVGSELGYDVLEAQIPTNTFAAPIIEDVNTIMINVEGPIGVGYPDPVAELDFINVSGTDRIANYYSTGALVIDNIEAPVTPPLVCAGPNSANEFVSTALPDLYVVGAQAASTFNFNQTFTDPDGLNAAANLTVASLSDPNTFVENGGKNITVGNVSTVNLVSTYETTQNFALPEEGLIGYVAPNQPNFVDLSGNIAGGEDIAGQFSINIAGDVDLHLTSEDANQMIVIDEIDTIVSDSGKASIDVVQHGAGLAPQDYPYSTADLYATISASGKDASGTEIATVLNAAGLSIYSSKLLGSIGDDDLTSETTKGGLVEGRAGDDLIHLNQVTLADTPNNEVVGGTGVDEINLYTGHLGLDWVDQGISESVSGAYFDLVKTINYIGGTDVVNSFVAGAGKDVLNVSLPSIGTTTTIVSYDTVDSIAQFNPANLSDNGQPAVLEIKGNYLQAGPSYPTGSYNFVISATGTDTLILQTTGVGASNSLTTNTSAIVLLGVVPADLVPGNFGTISGLVDAGHTFNAGSDVVVHTDSGTVDVGAAPDTETYTGLTNTLVAAGYQTLAGAPLTIDGTIQLGNEAFSSIVGSFGGATAGSVDQLMYKGSLSGGMVDVVNFNNGDSTYYTQTTNTGTTVVTGGTGIDDLVVLSGTAASMTINLANDLTVPAAVNQGVINNFENIDADGFTGDVLAYLAVDSNEYVASSGKDNTVVVHLQSAQTLAVDAGAVADGDTLTLQGGNKDQNVNVTKLTTVDSKLSTVTLDASNLSEILTVDVETGNDGATPPVDVAAGIVTIKTGTNSTTVTGGSKVDTITVDATVTGATDLLTGGPVINLGGGLGTDAAFVVTNLNTDTTINSTNASSSLTYDALGAKDAVTLTNWAVSDYDGLPPVLTAANVDISAFTDKAATLVYESTKGYLNVTKVATVGGTIDTGANTDQLVVVDATNLADGGVLNLKGSNGAETALVDNLNSGTVDATDFNGDTTVNGGDVAGDAHVIEGTGTNEINFSSEFLTSADTFKQLTATGDTTLNITGNFEVGSHDLDGTVNIGTVTFENTTTNVSVDTINANFAEVGRATGDHTYTYDAHTLTTGVLNFTGAGGVQTPVNSSLFNVIGGANNDLIAGGQNDDTLTGGGGADVLTGNGGSDEFNYQQTDYAPTPTDLTFAQEIENTGDVATGVVDQLVGFSLADGDTINFSQSGLGVFAAGDAAKVNANYAAAYADAVALWAGAAAADNYILEQYGSAGNYTSVLFVSDLAVAPTVGAIIIGQVGGYATAADALASIDATAII